MSNRSLIKIDGDFSVRSAEVSSEPRTHALHYKRSIGGSLFLGAFLAAFCAPYFLTDTAAGPEDSLFRLVTFLFSAFWMLGWSVGVAFIALLFLGSIFGRECLVVSPGQLVIRMELFGAGFSRTVRGSEITNLRRVEPESGEALSWRGPHLTLDYEGAAINFGCNVDRNRAELLISDINSIGLRKSVPLPRIDDANYADRRPRESHTPFRGNSIPEYATPPLTLTSLSTISLFAANLVPVVGVLMFGWSIGEVMLLYWAESAVIGFYNICKMWVIGRWAVLFMGPFFLGHYGAFMAFHLWTHD